MRSRPLEACVVPVPEPFGSKIDPTPSPPKKTAAAAAAAVSMTAGRWNQRRRASDDARPPAVGPSAIEATCPAGSGPASWTEVVPATGVWSTVVSARGAAWGVVAIWASSDALSDAGGSIGATA
ncbi:hypothetical protein ACL00T_15750 [Curtobacterium flaccumfaciens]